MFDLSAYGQWLPETHKKRAGTHGTPQNKAGVPRRNTAKIIKNNNLANLAHVEHLGTPQNKVGVPTNKLNNSHKNNSLESLEHLEHLEHRKTAMSEIDFLSGDDWEAYEERAAIMEHEGNLSRSEAEQQALVICLAEYRQNKTNQP